jgi:hypothetical protein
MKVFLSELAESKLLKLSEYLLEEWNLKTRDKFISKLNGKSNKYQINLIVVQNHRNLRTFINVL